MSNKTVIIKRVFEAFVKVQRSGKTNMLDSNAVNRLSGGLIERAEHLEIISNYDKYVAMYTTDLKA